MYTPAMTGYSAETVVRRITPSLYDRFYKTSNPIVPLTLRLKPGESAEFPFTADLNRFGSFESAGVCDGDNKWRCDARRAK